ncbi:hypothetical protein DdX_16954 [Ditylenchus destructor]|uniref:Uncharacterized protein n=1 Tax=Ditylenchus destructor TaxID=166010 RepID=A0AAD4QZK8_9BILA|nr:hypothetical protein DdX_16954 [Ditylenchus destructor]
MSVILRKLFFIFYFVPIGIALEDENCGQKCRQALSPHEPINPMSCEAFEILTECVYLDCNKRIPSSIQVDYSKFYSCPSRSDAAPSPKQLPISNRNQLPPTPFPPELRDKIVFKFGDRAYDCMLRPASLGPEEEMGCSTYFDLDRCLRNAGVGNVSDRCELVEDLTVRGFSNCGPNPIKCPNSAQMSSAQFFIYVFLVYCTVICELMR